MGVEFDPGTRIRITATSVCALVAMVTGCANFRNLSKDLKLIDEGYRISGIIENADDAQGPVLVSVVEWDSRSNQVFSGDQVKLSAGDAFVFNVKSPLNQYVSAFADANGNGRRDPGEAMWIHSRADGKPVAVALDGINRHARVDGRLSNSTHIPPGFRDAVDRFLAGRTIADSVTRQGVRISLGEVARLDDPRFVATRGEDGLWTPATVAIHSGFGIYFLEPYDPSRTPVLFVHGAAGSPQDWKFAMEKIDRRRYQPWFYFYPSGGRLENAASILNEGIESLHNRYGFERLNVVAHSMGGLVSRRFIVKNAIEDRQDYIRTFLTFSTPWGGHEAAAMGVKWAPAVVPSWRDMEAGSDYLDHLFDQRLAGKVNCHLFYSHRAKRSAVMPAENDGTVSVASQLRLEAKAEAVSVQGYDEDHVSILSASAPLKRASQILDAANP
ncbi:MAG: alpha/beta hydrolase [Verrucomicrobiales bacterium]